MDASPFFNILTNKTSFLRWAVDSYTTAVRRHSQSSLLELVNLALSIPVEVFPDRFLVDFQSQLMCRKKSSMSFTITFHDLPRSFMLCLMTMNSSYGVGWPLSNLFGHLSSVCVMSAKPCVLYLLPSLVSFYQVISGLLSNFCCIFE